MCCCNQNQVIKQGSSTWRPSRPPPHCAVAPAAVLRRAQPPVKCISFIPPHQLQTACYFLVMHKCTAAAGRVVKGRTKGDCVAGRPGVEMHHRYRTMTQKGWTRTPALWRKELSKIKFAPKIPAQQGTKQQNKVTHAHARTSRRSSNGGGPALQSHTRPRAIMRLRRPARALGYRTGVRGVC